MEIGRNTAFVILFVALLAVGAYLYVNTGSSGGQTISVSGNSEIDAQPDFVSIYVTIETLNASAQDSKERNAEISEKVINALTRIGIDESDIETISYNLYEDFEWRNNGRESKGWKTTNQIKVKLEDKDDNLKPRKVQVNAKHNSSVPFLDFPMEQDAKKMAETPYYILYLFENSIRKFIDSVLRKKLGNNWWSTFVTKAELIQKVNSRKQL